MSKFATKLALSLFALGLAAGPSLAATTTPVKPAHSKATHAKPAHGKTMHAKSSHGKAMHAKAHAKALHAKPAHIKHVSMHGPTHTKVGKPAKEAPMSATEQLNAQSLASAQGGKDYAPAGNALATTHIKSKM